MLSISDADVAFQALRRMLSRRNGRPDPGDDGSANFIVNRYRRADAHLDAHREGIRNPAGELARSLACRNADKHVTPIYIRCRTPPFPTVMIDRAASDGLIVRLVLGALYTE